MTDTLTMLPNVEAIVSKFLQAQAPMVALVGTRIYTALPKNAGYPAVRVHQFDDAKITNNPLWVVRASIEVECWGGSKDQAFAIATTAQAVLALRLEGTHTGGIVNGCDVGPLRDLPDPGFPAAKPRWLFTAYVTAHPI